jgi:hypothetical protein
MTFDERTAKEVGRMIVEALGDRLWTFVDAEVKRQLEASPHLYGSLRANPDGKYVASFCIYSSETDVTEIQVTLEDPQDYIGYYMDDRDIAAARQTIDGMRVLAAEAAKLADAGEEKLRRVIAEQNKDRT